MPALAIVSGLAALGAERLLGRRGWLLAIVVGLDGLLISGAPWPVANTPSTPPSIYAHVTADAGDSRLGVLDLPTDAGATMRTSRYLYWQTAAHHQPISYAPDARANTASLSSVPAFQALAVLCRRRADEQIGSPPSGASTNPRTLRRHGIRWLVLHPDVDPETFGVLQETLTSQLGKPAQEDENGALLWDLGP